MHFVNFREVKEKEDSAKMASTSTSSVQMANEMDTTEPDEIKRGFSSIDYIVLNIIFYVASNIYPS